MAREPTSRIRDLLTAKVEQAQTGDLFALLDLPETASDKDIKDAYFKLARLVHPDSLQRQSLADRRGDAALIFEKLTEAYKTLSDPIRRKAYIEAHRAGRPVREDPKALEEASKIALHQGRQFLNRRAYAAAEQCFREYIQLLPDDPRGFLFLGWAIFQNAQRPAATRLEEARICFSRALKLDGENPDAWYYLALYCKETGSQVEVERHLKKALQLKPDHVPAQREMRLLEMRRKAEPAAQSVGSYVRDLWGKLTRRK